MTYNEWLELIDLVKRSNRNTTYLDQMLAAPNNESINEMLKPKLVELITDKFAKAVKRIINNISEVFKNPNSLDFAITNFEKEIQYLLKLCNLPELDNTTKEELISTITKERNNIYDILINRSLKIDRSGMYKLIIEKKKNGKR